MSVYLPFVCLPSVSCICRLNEIIQREGVFERREAPTSTKGGVRTAGVRLRANPSPITRRAARVSPIYVDRRGGRGVVALCPYEWPRLQPGKQDG